MLLVYVKHSVKELNIQISILEVAMLVKVHAKLVYQPFHVFHVFKDIFCINMIVYKVLSALKKLLNNLALKLTNLYV